jgi:hypothetical protein
VAVTASCGVFVDGERVDVFVGYSRDHEGRVAAGGFESRLGKGKVVMHTVPGLIGALRGTSAGMHPVLARRLIANSLTYLRN